MKGLCSAALLWALSLVFLFAGTGYSLTTEMGLEELTEEASHILVGDVEDITSEVGEDGDVHALVSIHVAYTLKGRLDVKEVVVWLEGEWADSTVVWNEGQAQLESGQKVLVFLTQR